MQMKLCYVNGMQLHPWACNGMVSLGVMDFLGKSKGMILEI